MGDRHRVNSYDGETFRVVWAGDSETDCVEICRELQLARIEYKVSQKPVSRSSRMEVIWRFEVAVPDSEYGLAKEALGVGLEDDAGEDQGLEINESPSAILEDGSDEDNTRADAYLKRWEPERATVEVWSQGASDTRSIVELSLSENLIHYRLDRARNGTRKFFVLPEDERRAREILREIEKGEPPK